MLIMGVKIAIYAESRLLPHNKKGTISRTIKAPMAIISNNLNPFDAEDKYIFWPKPLS